MLLHAQRERDAGAAMISRDTSGEPRGALSSGVPRLGWRATPLPQAAYPPPPAPASYPQRYWANLVDLPVAVLATLLDRNITISLAWANYVQHDWAAYLAARTSRSSTG